MRLRKNIAISESGFIFNPSTGDSYTVNQAAYKILELLREPIEVNAIYNHLMEEYEVDKLRMGEDLDDFIGHLKQLGLIENG